MLSTKTLLAAAAAAAFSLPASAVTYSQIGLGFEGISAFDAGLGEIPTVQVAEFYNGGTSMSEDGSTPVAGPGTNVGISFATSALGFTSFGAGGTGNFGPRWPEGLPAGDRDGSNTIAGAGDSAVFFTEDITIDVPQGFNGGMSFLYATFASTVTVQVYSGLGGTGALLGATGGPLSATSSCGISGNAFCAWGTGSVAIPGGATALSVVISVPFDGAYMDNLSFGSLKPFDGFVEGPIVPEPSTYALMALGLLGVAAAARRRRG